MDPSISQHQDMCTNVSSLENMLNPPKPQPERKPRPQPEKSLNCPRCDSTHTKFCYYNNYSLSQPRYFCKSCRRYWTQGGTLRNVPVGGGCRRNRRLSPSSSSSKSPKHHQPHNLMAAAPNPNFDLSPAFRLHNKQLPPGFDKEVSIFGNPNSSHPINGVNFGHSPSGFLFHSNLCDYGLGNGEVGSVGMAYDQEISYGGATAGNGTDEGEDQKGALWGFPWVNIIGGDGNDYNLGDVESSGRESWNGITSSWHGLLNSPLM